MPLKNNVKDKLIKNVPKTIRTSSTVQSITEAFGELVDEFRFTINDFKNYKDYLKSNNKNLRNTGLEGGLVFPRNFNFEERRILIRDLVNIFRSNGSMRIAEFIFKLIGLEVTFKPSWVITDDVDKLKEEGHSNKIEDMFFGEEKVYFNGVYADLEDIDGNKWNKIPILGEVYSENRKISDYVAIKMPYLLIEISSEEYSTFTDPVIIDGEEYSFDQTELFEIQKSLLDFLFDYLRPAHVVYVLIGKLEEDIFFDFFEYDTEESFTLEDDGLGLSRFDGTHLYGQEADRYAIDDFFSISTFGGNMERVSSPATLPDIVRSYTSENSGTQRYIPTFKKSANVELVVPTGSDYNLYKAKSIYDKNSLSYTVHGVVLNETSFVRKSQFDTLIVGYGSSFSDITDSLYVDAWVSPEDHTGLDSYDYVIFGSYPEDDGGYGFYFTENNELKCIVDGQTVGTVSGTLNEIQQISLMVESDETVSFYKDHTLVNSITIPNIINKIKNLNSPKYSGTYDNIHFFRGTLYSSKVFGRTFEDDTSRKLISTRKMVGDEESLIADITFSKDYEDETGISASETTRFVYMKYNWDGFWDDITSDLVDTGTEWTASVEDTWAIAINITDIPVSETLTLTVKD